MTPLADTEFKNLFNVCERVRLNLPSGLSDCSQPYKWRQLPNLTADNYKSPTGIFSSKEFTLNMPSQFGVYCTQQQCNEPSQEYCAAVAGNWDNCLFERTVFKGVHTV